MRRSVIIAVIGGAGKKTTSISQVGRREKSAHPGSETAAAQGCAVQLPLYLRRTRFRSLRPASFAEET